MTVEQVVAKIDALNLNGFPHDHVQLVCETVQEFQPDIICEWGTNMGNSGRMLYEASFLCSCPVHTIEAGDQDRPALLHGCDVTLHRGNGLKVTLKATTNSDRPLILIDDNHVYQETYDTLVILRDCRPGAVLLIHDAATSEAGYAIKAYLAQNGGYDVRESLVETGLTRLWPQSLSM